MAVAVAGFMERMHRIGLGVLRPAVGLSVLAQALHSAWKPSAAQGAVLVGEHAPLRLPIMQLDVSITLYYIQLFPAVQLGGPSLCFVPPISSILAALVPPVFPNLNKIISGQLCP